MSLGALALLLLLPGCRLGPYWDDLHYRSGPDVAALRETARTSIVPGETSLQQAIELLGPPQRIERRGDEHYLVWRQENLDRDRYGLALGAFGFSVTMFDADRSSDPLESLFLIVRDDVVEAK